MCRGMRCQSAHLSVRFASMSPRTRNQARFRQSCGPLTSLSTNQITAGQGSPDGRHRERSGPQPVGRPLCLSGPDDVPLLFRPGKQPPHGYHHPTRHYDYDYEENRDDARICRDVSSRTKSGPSPTLQAFARASAARTHGIGPAPGWQNSMATNWPQQVNPRAWRSARCSTNARSNSARENNCNIWPKMLDTRITAAVVLLRFTSLQRKP